MSNVSDFSVGVVHELTITAAKAGFTPDEFGVLAKKEDLLRQFRQVLLGTAAIVDRQHLDHIKALAEAVVSQPKAAHVIDCDAAPFVPDGWSVEEHQKGGQFPWNKDAQKDALFLSSGQQDDHVLKGNQLRKELSKQPVLNANVLDYLLAHPELIPEEWKGKYVFFWGTIYRYRDGYLCVRYLCWVDGRWDWGFRWLVDSWYSYRPAAVRAS